jgi:hypothetical protein
LLPGLLVRRTTVCFVEASIQVSGIGFCDPVSKTGCAVAVRDAMENKANNCFFI